MSYTIIQIFDNCVSIKCNVTHQTISYFMQHILSSRNEAVNSSNLLLGDILVKDDQNYLHLVEYSTNRIYPTSQYLSAFVPKSWFLSYFPYIRPFEIPGDNFNFVLGTKIIEYTFLHNSNKLFTEIKKIAPGLEEILNFFLGMMNRGSFYKSMAEALLNTDHVIAIAENCMHYKNQDIRVLASTLKIKLTILQIPGYNISLINPNGEIEFTLLFIQNKYQILYTEQEKYIMENPSSLKFFERFDQTQQDGYNVQEMKENFDNSLKKHDAYKQILAKFTENFIKSNPLSAIAIIERLKNSKFLSLEIENLIKSLICSLCKKAEKIMNLECNHKICELCFINNVSEATQGKFVLNQLEGEANIICKSCKYAVSGEFIKKNLPNYDYYAQAAEDRINFTCYKCNVDGKLDMFLTDCRHTCKNCTVELIRNGGLKCEFCFCPYYYEVYTKFMKLKYDCEGCSHTKFHVKDFERKLCKHTYCIECIENCSAQICYEKCPKYNLDTGEYKSLFYVKCKHPTESCLNIFKRNTAYWIKKTCQCQICLGCMFSKEYNNLKFQQCPICLFPFDEVFIELLNKEYSDFQKVSDTVFDCQICYNSKPYEKFMYFMTCECKVCRKCFNNYIKENLSDINLISRAGCCPVCSSETDPLQLESFFLPEDWYKYNTFSFQMKYGEIITCPKCKEPFNPGVSRCVICPNKDCNYKYCKQCEEEYHKDGDCEEVFIQGRIEILKNEEGGVTQCPGCRLPYIKNPENCEHATCINSACGVEFCFQCACIRSPTLEHGGHYHRPNCKFFAPYDGKDDVFKEKCTACKKIGKLCKPPKLLKTPRLVAKEEVE